MQKKAQTSFKSQQRKERSTMNRILIYRLIAAAALLGACTGSILILHKNREQTDLLPPGSSYAEAWNGISRTTATMDSKTTSAQITTVTENGFLLQLTDNTLYVYIHGYEEAMESYSVTAAWLPDYDRILLENGLFVATAEELRQLLEDYTS